MLLLTARSEIPECRYTRAQDPGYALLFAAEAALTSPNVLLPTRTHTVNGLSVMQTHGVLGFRRLRRVSLPTSCFYTWPHTRTGVGSQVSLRLSDTPFWRPNGFIFGSFFCLSFLFARFLLLLSFLLYPSFALGSRSTLQGVFALCSLQCLAGIQ
jgi:hypothetical protein